MDIARTLLLTIALLGSLVLADDALADIAPVARAHPAAVDAATAARSSTVSHVGSGLPTDVALAKAPLASEVPNAATLRATGAGREAAARTGLDSVSRHGFSLRTALLGGSAVASAVLSFAARRRTAR